MDNLPAHKLAGIREAIERIDAKLLFLPHYSPDFNPIETAFYKLKAWLKNVAPRKVEQLWDTIAEVIDDTTPQHARNFFIAAGYKPD
jgi:transposase